MERELIQLPNKDLWRGYNPEVEAKDTVDNTPLPSKLDAAMADIMKFNGVNADNQLSCTWCGQQFDLKNMREHLKQSHPSVVNPPNAGELALAAATIDKA